MAKRVAINWDFNKKIRKNPVIVTSQAGTKFRSQMSKR